ncbi:hypothetical protein ABG768_026599 [Culter alburnus]|uniref:Reverse transcriptase domain-containing protein n=1 Tax=Culter alburnus TaxID=194366 RepID=A0AAW2AAK4_CULAL
MCKATARHGTGIQWTGFGRLTDLDFAIDITLLEETAPKLQEAPSVLHLEASKIGLQISSNKSKILWIGSTDALSPVVIDTETLESVDNFCYLGSMICHDGSINREVRSRIGKVAAVFRRLNVVWSLVSFSLNIKLCLYSSTVVPIALYASETRKMTVAISHKINVFQLRCLRRILQFRYADLLFV